MDILSRIIKYESDVFEEYTLKRQKLLDNIKNINIISLNKTQTPPSRMKQIQTYKII